jgi:hypothetical protein
MSTTPFATTHGALAPVDKDEPADKLTEERREERLNMPHLSLFLNRTLDSIATLDQSENLKIHNAMVKAVAYYDGRSDGRIENGEWVDNEAITGEIIVADNEVKKQVDKLLMEMSRSVIKYTAEPQDSHSAAMREAAQFAQTRIDTNQKRIETEPFVQAENQSLLLKTIGYRYTFFDKSAESRERSVELAVVRSMAESKKLAVCRTCGMTKGGDPQIGATGNEAMKEAPCRYCGDTMKREIGTPSQSISVEQKEVPAGRPVTVRPDATMVQLDLNARDIPSSAFIRWRLVLRRCDWEAMYPDTAIPSNEESDEAKRKADAQNNPSNTTSFDSATDTGGGDQFERIEGELVWLDPKVYARYRSKERESLGKDRTLEANALFAEQFPEGVCVTRIGRKILDLYPSNKNKCWVLCVYGIREHALHGSGINALLGVQDTINDENAFIVAHHYYAAAGREFIRSGAIEGGKLPAINEVGIINNAPDDRDAVDWAYGRSQPEGLSGDVYAFRADMRGSMQDAAGTSSLSLQGAADLKALGTATGVEASRDQAVGRMIPNRKLQAFMGTEWITQVLELEREHYTAEMFLPLADKANEKGEITFTERGVRTFFQSDIRSDFALAPSEGSWMPTTPAQDRANASEFGMLGAQLSKSQNGPELLSLLAPKYGIDYDVNEWGAGHRAASLRLEEYARVCGGLSGNGQPSPEMVNVVFEHVAEWARVDPLMDNHAAFQDFYQDWWVSDEGRNADSLLRMVVKEVFMQHKGGLVVQAQEQSKDMVLAQVPEKVAGAIEGDIAHDRQLEHTEEAADLQDERELLKGSIIGGQAQAEPPPS